MVRTPCFHLVGDSLGHCQKKKKACANKYTHGTFKHGYHFLLKKFYIIKSPVWPLKSKANKSH